MRSVSVSVINGVVTLNGRRVHHHAATRSVLAVVRRWWRYRGRTGKGGGWQLVIEFRRTP